MAIILWDTLIRFLTADYSMTIPDEDDEEKEEPDGQIVNVPASKAKAEPPVPEISLVFSAEEVRKRLEDNDLTLALILVSTRLEMVMAIGIKEHLSITHRQYEEILGNASIGTLGQICSRIGVYENEFEQAIIDDIAHNRRNLIHHTPEHGHNYLQSIEQNEDLQQDVEEAIEDAIEFIESVRV